MRVLFFICLPLVLFSPLCVRADPPVHFPGNAAVSQKGYHSPVMDAMEVMLDRYNDLHFHADGKGLASARKAVVEVLEKGGNPNDYSGSEGLLFSPLMLAVRMQDVPLIELLLSKGADPNREENINLMSELINSDSPNPDILYLLIKKGWRFDPNVPTGSRLNASSCSLPLIAAVYAKNVKVVEALLKLGANPWLTDAFSTKEVRRNAFDVCEGLTKDCRPEVLHEARVKQAAIKKLLDGAKFQKVL